MRIHLTGFEEEPREEEKTTSPLPFPEPSLNIISSLHLPPSLLREIHEKVAYALGVLGVAQQRTDSGEDGGVAFSDFPTQRPFVEVYDIEGGEGISKAFAFYDTLLKLGKEAKRERRPEIENAFSVVLEEIMSKYLNVHNRLRSVTPHPVQFNYSPSPQGPEDHWENMVAVQYHRAVGSLRAALTVLEASVFGLGELFGMEEEKERAHRETVQRRQNENEEGGVDVVLWRDPVTRSEGEPFTHFFRRSLREIGGMSAELRHEIISNEDPIETLFFRGLQGRWRVENNMPELEAPGFAPTFSIGALEASIERVHNALSPSHKRSEKLEPEYIAAMNFILGESFEKLLVLARVFWFSIVQDDEVGKVEEASMRYSWRQVTLLKALSESRALLRLPLLLSEQSNDLPLSLRSSVIAPSSSALGLALSLESGMKRKAEEAEDTSGASHGKLVWGPLMDEIFSRHGLPSNVRVGDVKAAEKEIAHEALRTVFWSLPSRERRRVRSSLASLLRACEEKKEKTSLLFSFRKRLYSACSVVNKDRNGVKPLKLTKLGKALLSELQEVTKPKWQNQLPFCRKRDSLNPTLTVEENKPFLVRSLLSS